MKVYLYASSSPVGTMSIGDSLMGPVGVMEMGLGSLWPEKEGKF